MSRNKAKGTAWETAIVRFLQEHGWPHAERRALHGTLDKGDITGIPGLCIEAKSAARHELALWWDEAKAEKKNANAATTCVWFKRRGKTSPAHGFVLLDGEEYVQLLKAAGW